MFAAVSILRFISILVFIQYYFSIKHGKKTAKACLMDACGEFGAKLYFAERHFYSIMYTSIVPSGIPAREMTAEQNQ